MALRSPRDASKVPLTSGYRILDHPSDLGIEAVGRSLAEAFESAARGLMSVILDLKPVREVESHEIVLTAEDIEHLLVKWLGEILYRYDGQLFVSKDFHIMSLTPTQLSATIEGELFDPERHKTKLDVKAITYHQLSVEEGTDISRVRVFLDI